MNPTQQSARVVANFGKSLAVSPMSGDPATPLTTSPPKPLQSQPQSTAQSTAQSPSQAPVQSLMQSPSQAPMQSSSQSKEPTKARTHEPAEPTKDSTPLPVEHAVPLKKLPLLVAGDIVELERDEHLGSCRITKLQKRTSVLERNDGRRGMKAMAANLTHLAIVSAAPPGIDTLLIDQFCLAAHRSGIDAIIVINKADLLNDDELREANEILDVYRQMDYAAVLVNTKQAGGIDDLYTELAGRAVTFVGASGVGKSSIIGALLPDLDVRTGAISAATGQGSHTTTVTCWYEFDHAEGSDSIGSSALIDSPGVRQYSVAHLEPVDVREGYRDIKDAAQSCRFANCVHRVEPGCNVQASVSSGEIAQWRYDNYCKLLDVEPI